MKPNAPAILLLRDSYDVIFLEVYESKARADEHALQLLAKHFAYELTGNSEEDWEAVLSLEGDSNCRLILEEFKPRAFDAKSYTFTLAKPPGPIITLRATTSAFTPAQAVIQVRQDLMSLDNGLAGLRTVPKVQYELSYPRAGQITEAMIENHLAVERLVPEESEVAVLSGGAEVVIFYVIDDGELTDLYVFEEKRAASRFSLHRMAELTGQEVAGTQERCWQAIHEALRSNSGGPGCMFKLATRKVR